MTRNETNGDLTRGIGDRSVGGSGRGATGSAGSGPTAADGPLAGIRRSETIADRADFDALDAELPEEWTAKPDIVQFGPEPLAETIKFDRTAIDPTLILKPTDPSDPGGEIEFHERGGPRASRRPTRTVDSLPEALRVAVNRVHQLDR